MTDPGRVEAVLLDPACTREDAAALVERAVAGRYAAVCLPPTLLPLCGVPEDLRLVSLAGHPTGRHHPLVKASEAHMAVVNGAHEVHAVLDAANVVAGDFNALLSEIVTLREAVPYPAVLRVSPGDSGVAVGEQQLRTVCRAAVTAGADMVAEGTGAAGADTGAALDVLLDALAGTSVTVAAAVDRPGVTRVRVPAGDLGHPEAAQA